MTTASQTESIRGEIGQGIYSLGDLRSYLALQAGEAAGGRALDWLTRVLNPVAHRPKQADYSFSDLVSLFVVRELLEKGVAPATIRDAELWLREKWGTDRPFTHEDIATDGAIVYGGKEPASAGPPAAIEAASRGGQHAMLDLIRDELTTVHYAGSFASRWEPTARVVLDPSIQFGDPVVAGTRLRTADAAARAARVGAKRAAEMLNVDQASMKAAVRFEQRRDALAFA